MDKRLISGTDRAGRRHSVRITEDRGETTWVECDSCGHRQRAVWAAREKAFDHLGAAHSAYSRAPGRAFDEERTPEYTARLWISTGCLVLALLILLFAGR
ncbi:hypothetical protein ACPC54_37830 [Kitasatospora sp. NPDC094028]